MTNFRRTLREHIAQALYDAAVDDEHEERYGPEGYYERRADLVLAALGLDDLDAAVERGAGALNFLLEHTGDWSGATPRMSRAVLEAALTATSESEES